MKRIITLLIVAMAVGMSCIGAVSAAPSTHAITPLIVTATGYNSAVGGYFWCTGEFYNYNPFTGNWGVLEWNPKGTPEGEWTASDSDADFSINGHCKAWGSQMWLVPVLNN